VAKDALNYLLGGTGAKVVATPVTGLFGGSVEPSLGVSVTFDESERGPVLAAIAKFAQNFNQFEMHARQSTKDAPGTVYDDGSYTVPVYTWQLVQPLDRAAIQRIIDDSGLYGLTFGDKFVEAYFVGDVKNESEINDFTSAANRATQSLGQSSSGLRIRSSRLWAYSHDGHPGTVGYDRIAGDVSYGQAAFSQTARRIAQYLTGDKVATFKQATKITRRQFGIQRGIAEIYESLPDNDLANPQVSRAYSELADEVLEQFQALPVKVEVLTGLGEPYKNSDEMRRDILQNNHLFIFGTTPETFGPEGVDFSGHPLLGDSGMVDSKDNPLLFNDLLRAVHDYYAHAMSPTQFGPRGEEAAWKNHMAMTKSPWARWALTSETRGQNSWVNFRPDLDPATSIKDRPFARQKVALLPLRYALTGNKVVDAPVLELQQQLAESAGSAKFNARSGFYSALSEGVDALTINKAMPGAWKAAIKGLVNKGAVKQDEVMWSGLEDWLDMQPGKVSKAEVVGYLGANGVRVDEVVLGETAQMRERTMRLAADRVDAIEDRIESAVGGTPAQMREITAQLRSEIGRASCRERV
jgi:hypothetical protein